MEILHGSFLCHISVWPHLSRSCMDTMLGMFDYTEHWIMKLMKKKETETEYDKMLLAYCIDFSLYIICCSVVNEPLESISLDLGFAGNTLAEGISIQI